ncbi:hypothetical protein D3C86_1540380 [compost metagenome]
MIGRVFSGNRHGQPVSPQCAIVCIRTQGKVRIHLAFYMIHDFTFKFGESNSLVRSLVDRVSAEVFGIRLDKLSRFVCR